jgi:uncharacterized membrane-anchored protein
MVLLMSQDDRKSRTFESKVPLVTFVFWLIKICATTLGETGGDAVSMTLEWGYALSSALFLAIFIVCVTGQIAARRYHPFLYWAVVVATTTVGTTMSDFLDRTAGLGYMWSSLIEFVGVLAVLLVWYRVRGRIEFENITSRADEAFYWLTILVSNTLGTALGDFVADDTGLGFAGGAALFTGLLLLVVAAYYFTKMSHVALFWTAYVLSRPLGATLGDTLTKPTDEGGLHLSRIASSLVIAAAMVVLILITFKSQRRPRPPKAETIVDVPVIG